MTGELFTLLQRRMADENVGSGEPVAVAELHKRLLPYHTCRDRLGFATKSEYDVALLRLLADDRRVSMAEPALREAVRAEIRQPEPGLAFLHRFAASEIRLESGFDPAAPGEEDGVPEPVTAPVAAPPAAQAAPPPDSAGEVAASTCRRCAARLPAVEGVRYCPACGADQLVPTCSECGAEVGEGWRYCAFCGNVQDPDSIEE